MDDPDELLTLRVQYVVDTDPFNSLSMYPAPTRAPTYSFVCTTPLATQLGAILRLLGAPQRVRCNIPIQKNIIFLLVKGLQIEKKELSMDFLRHYIYHRVREGHNGMVLQ